MSRSIIPPIQSSGLTVDQSLTRKQISIASSMKSKNKNKSSLSMFSSLANPTSGTMPGETKSNRLRPSELKKTSVVNPSEYPMIVSHVQVTSGSTTDIINNSTVPYNQPLFQPSPNVIIFQDYAPYATHEKKIYFRNNDTIARRIKVMQPDSPFFEISAAKTPSAEPLKASKVAAGIGVCYTITFKPKDVRDYSWDLVCCTERETFIVPIRALGLVPKVSFPDEINFKSSTIGLETSKIVLLKNIGSASAKFSLSCLDPSIFTCPLEEFSMESGASLSINLLFNPKEGKTYNSDMKVEFNQGMICYVALVGSGQNVDVAISASLLSMEPTFISLRSQRTLRIVNRSDIPIKFKWKSFSCVEDENRERERLVQELDRMEAIEIEPHLQAANAIAISEQDKESLSLASGEDNEPSFETVSAQAELVRKYRNLRRALENDGLLFVDNIFEITPLEGQVWAESELEVIVSFHPDTACLFEGLAYLDVSGREERLWLSLSGEGVGAYAVLSFDILDIGDVFINNEYLYSVTMKNKGDIPALWSYLPPSTVIGTKFHLSPKDGALAVGQSKSISIRFECDILGDFCETILFSLQGNEDPISCKIKGSVIGPSLHFDCLKIDFGIVSFDYLHQETVRLVNTSSISTVYSLNIPQDSDESKKEFDINPCGGTLGPGEFVDIAIDFIPNAAKVYEFSLDVDVLGVGESYYKIPLLAECVVGSLRIQQKDLQYGESFIRHSYEKTLTLQNTSNVVYTKFEVLPQLQHTTSIAIYHPEVNTGFIAPGQSIDIIVQLTAQKIGSFRIAMAIAVCASKDTPQQISLSCSSIGPRLLVDKNEIRWGNINCLSDHIKSIIVTNDSLIPAPIKMFSKLARSKFTLSASEKTLAPMEAFQLDITCNLDDSIFHKDELYLVVDEGDHIMVPLTANGIGTTMFCMETLDVIDLGVHLTNLTFEKKFFLENRGRRPQQLHWYNKTIKDSNAARAIAAKKLSKVSGAAISRNLMSLEPKFKIEPCDITLRPHTATTFTIKGYSSSPGKLAETFVLESLIGKERSTRDIIITKVICEVVDPLVEFSSKELNFVYKWVKDEEVRPIMKDLVITNKSALNLNLVLKADIPFNLNSFEHSLSPGQQVEICVEFYPLYKDDRILHSVINQLSVAYRGHPQRDSISLNGEIQFPNLGFDKKNVDFGCVLNDTIKSIIVRVTNTSKLDANFEWSVLESANSKSLKIAKGRTFDILPFRSFLRPGEVEDITFSMIGIPEHKIAATAVCTVDGGPEYKIPLSGEASAVSYTIDASHLDFGSVIFTDFRDRDLIIQNTGKVSFPFNFQYSELSSVGIIEALPPSGKIEPGEKFRVVIRVFPVLPCTFFEILIVKVAHFDPIRLKCLCKSIFSTVYLSLPRLKRVGPNGEVADNLALQSIWERTYEAASNNLIRDPLSESVCEDKAFYPSSTTAEDPPYDSESISYYGPPPKSSPDIAKKYAALAVDVEIQRMTFCKCLEDTIKSDHSKANKFAESKNLQAYISQYVEVDKIVSASYILDFGNVILNQTKKKNFRITNATATGVISWSHEYRYLGGTGFSIDPEKVSKLPELASVDVLVRFTAKKSTGRREVTLPLERKNAPTLNIILTANVCLPEIELSAEVLSFDRTYVGFSQRMFVKFTNPTVITAAWSTRKTGKDESRFILEPSSGSLIGGKSCIVNVEFIPNDYKKFSTDISVIVETNSRVKCLKLVGEGTWSTLVFTPYTVDLGPYLPFTKSADKYITIENTGDRAVELTSLDFDENFKAEEEKLMIFNGFGSDGIFRWDMSRPDEFSFDNLYLCTSKDTPDTRVDDVSATEQTLFEDAPIRRVIGPRDTGEHQDYLVIGPRVSGVTTLSRSLSKFLRLPVRTIDEILTEIAETKGPTGVSARRVLGINTSSEAEELVDKERQLLAASDESKRVAVEVYKKSMKGKMKDKDIPAEVYLTQEAAEYDSYLNDKVLNIKLLQRLILFRQSWDDAGYGFIIDGIFSKLCDPCEVLKACRESLSRVFILELKLTGGLDSYKSKLETILKLKIAEEDALRRAYERSFSILGNTLNSTPAKSRSGKKSPTTELSRRSAIAPIESITPSFPVGDESWFDISTGRLTELDQYEYKSMDAESRSAYLSQFRYSLRIQLTEINDVLLRLRETLDNESAFDFQNESNQGEAVTSSTDNDALPNRLILHNIVYTLFIDKVSCLIPELFDIAGGSSESALQRVHIETFDDDVTVFNSALIGMKMPSTIPPDPDAIPSTQNFKLIRKPIHRYNISPLKYFEILEKEVIVVQDTVPQKKSKPAAGKHSSSESLETLPTASPTRITKWNIPPRESVIIRVNFKCMKIGSFQEQLRFEVADSKQEYSIACSGCCDIPRINDDPRNVFMKRLKALSNSKPHPSRRFVLAENFYSFGPLLLYKKPERRNDESLQLFYSTNFDFIRLTNSGKYPALLDLSIDDSSDETAKGVFLIDVYELRLEEGESKDLKVWAFPTAAKIFNSSLVICVHNNPTPIVYSLNCIGVEPSLEIDGPWSEAIDIAQANVNSCKDKKLLKELEAKLSSVRDILYVDMDRTLVGKTESRCFTIKNVSLLPILWEIDKAELQESNILSFSLTQGQLDAGASTSIILLFESSEAISVQAKFVLKYSDTEQGLENPSRVRTTQFKVSAEAYMIQTGLLNSAGQDLAGNEIDFGVMRVGDIVCQSFKISNKGKYRIGFQLGFRKSILPPLLTIDTWQGFIDTGSTPVEIRLTFCCSEAEINLQGCKDLKIKISEPLTGQIVEEFPLLISAVAVYSKFRMLPLKGVSFGAVRYDAEVKRKRVEIHNEGKFEFTYVVCSPKDNSRGVQSLDREAFSCYAFNTPPGLRAANLGSDYLERIDVSHVLAKGKKETKTALASKREIPKTAYISTVIDPDQLVQESVPEDLLVLSAFSVSSRVGIVPPGYSASFEILFNPSQVGVSRCKLQILISGINFQEPVAQCLDNFEINGESCVPAIVVNDAFSIFEEQEIVRKLSDSSISSFSGDAMFEKVPPGKVVYSEQEKTLVFGPIMCSQVGTKGVLERIKISNPTKIDTRVNFKLEASHASSDAGAKKAKESKKAASQITQGDTFTLSPSSWRIPPHESRYVNIYFNPKEIKVYKAKFLAEIDLESDSSASNSSKQLPAPIIKSDDLIFNLAGTGTLPSIAIDSPTERCTDGSVSLDFNRVHVGKRFDNSVVLRNSGFVPVTCLFEFTGDSHAFSFPFKGASAYIQPGCFQDIKITFCPKLTDGAREFAADIKVTVLNNPYDHYVFKLRGISYSCDAVFDNNIETDVDDIIRFPEINLADGPSSSNYSVFLRSVSQYNLRYELFVETLQKEFVAISPSVGHLSALSAQEIHLKFNASSSISLSCRLKCKLSRIKLEGEIYHDWNDSMKIIRVCTHDDLILMKEYETAVKEHAEKASKNKRSKGNAILTPLPLCSLQLVPRESEDDTQMVYEMIPEPVFNVLPTIDDSELELRCEGVADIVKYNCEGKDSNIPFVPTFMFQKSVYTFNLINECNLTLPVSWLFEEIRKRGNNRLGTAQILSSRGASRQQTSVSITNSGAIVPNPFSIEPEYAAVKPNSIQSFCITFSPTEIDDFVYALKGQSLSLPDLSPSPSVGEDCSQEGDAQRSSIRMVVRGTAKRPVCHFEMKESTDYLSRRPANMKNEHGLLAPIEGEIKVAEVESIGLRARNTYRFSVLNTTCENFEFVWEPVGESSQYWRCVYSSGMLFSGKRVGMVFEYLPEDVNIAESFFKFRLVKSHIEQLFLFTGNVREPKVFFSQSKLNFQSVMLSGEGSSEIITLENSDYIPFNFSFDKSTLLQLQGPSGRIVDLFPLTGVVPPNGSTSIHLTFKPQEEMLYNFNLSCEVKRKPTKLFLNIKGEGYAVHSLIQLESDDSIPTNLSRLTILKPSPAINTLDFGTVQLRESTSKKMSITNTGKYNFDYAWETDFIGSVISITGAKLNGTLKKGEFLSFDISFSPKQEEEIGNLILSFVVAGKYIYRIAPRGVGVLPALRFSFMNFDFGSCFISSPGGSLVIEESILRLVNHDASANISIECLFQKTLSLWVECPPTVIEAGASVHIPIRFAPRESKSYIFSVPFIVNGSTKVTVNLSGRGVVAKLELANPSQHRINFGVVDIGSEIVKTVPLVNRSSKPIVAELIENLASVSSLNQQYLSVSHNAEFRVDAKSTTNISIVFNPKKRVPLFSEDLFIKYAGLQRKLLTITGRAQGAEVILETDSIPFGTVVEASQKVKKLRLENNGDIPISFRWSEFTFGPHFSISPVSGKVSNGSDISFEVKFKPTFTDSDIRQENITLNIAGMQSLTVTCTGVCVPQPLDSVRTLDFSAPVRSTENKSIKISNPSDKEWYVSPALKGGHWSIPHEINIPAKGSSEINIKYYPLLMTIKESREHSEVHAGNIFIALPDGDALLYNLRGVATAPLSCGNIDIITAAKRSTSFIAHINNWLGDYQKFEVTVDILEKPSPAVFVVCSNVVEIPPNGIKEFSMRFTSFVEGVSRGKVTFKNILSGEYLFYDFTATVSGVELHDTISMESPLRQSSKRVFTVDNPLDSSIPITMGNSKPDVWWTCDSSAICLKELCGLTGNNEGSYEIEYRPTTNSTKGNEEVFLRLVTKELGEFKIQLHLKVLPPTSRPIIRFEAPLGTTQSETVSIQVYNKVKCDYVCSVAHSGTFSVQKSLIIEATSKWEGETARLTVHFDPSEVGERRDILKVSHPEGGVYEFDLVAICTPPAPQGPFIVSSSSPVTIPFRNCFTTSMQWTLSVDSSCFKLQSTSVTVGAKAESSCIVHYEPKGDVSTVTGKLFISTGSHTPWVYYLKGIVDTHAGGGTKSKEKLK